MAQLRILRWGSYPGLSRRAHCNHKGPHKRDASGFRVRKRRCNQGSRVWSHVFWRWRKVSWAIECRCPLEAGKDRHILLPSLANTLILDFWPPKLQESQFVLFKAVKIVVICHSSNKKWMYPESGTQASQYIPIVVISDLAWAQERYRGSCNDPSRMWICVFISSPCLDFFTALQCGKACRAAPLCLPSLISCPQHILQLPSTLGGDMLPRISILLSGMPSPWLLA